MEEQLSPYFEWIPEAQDTNWKPMTPQFYWDSLTIAQLKTLLPSIYHRAINARIKELIKK